MKMYEKVKDLSKRTLALYLVFSIVFMTLVYDLIAPLDVYAKEFDDNPPDGVIDLMEDGDTMKNNWGTIKSNSGQVENNMGSVGTDGDGGYVTNNYGTVYNGSIDNNYGIVNGESNVDHNWASGTVNDGWVNYNHHGTDDATKRDGLATSVTHDAATHNGDIRYEEWNSGPKPIPPKYVAPVKEQEEAYTGPAKQEEEDSSSQPAYDPAKFGFDTLKIVLKTGELENKGNTITIDMGKTVSYTPDMLQTLVNANTSGVEVVMSMISEGREFTFTIPSGANMTLIKKYIETMSFAAQGYSFLFNLIPGAILSYTDDEGNEIIMTNKMTDTQASKLFDDATNMLNSMTDEQLYAYLESIYGPDYAKMINSATPKQYTRDGLTYTVPVTADPAGLTLDPLGTGVTGTRAGRTADRSGVLGVKAKNDETSLAADNTGKEGASEAAATGSDPGTTSAVAVQTAAENEGGIMTTDPEMPLASTSYAESSNMNFIWLLGVGAAAGAGVVGYEKHKKKVTAGEEAKKYKK